MIARSFTLAVLLLAACNADNAADRSTEAEDAAAPAAQVPPAPAVPVPVSPPATPKTEEPGAMATQEGAAIPTAFTGHYASDLTHCEEHGELSLEITPDKLRFYESTGEPTSVKQVGDRAIEVTANYQGEGQTWIRTHRLELSADGKTLTVTSDGGTVTRVHCPG